ncbi:hypothetical protein PAHAL_9G078100 [Panicum hallii]|uniref:Secreted protein n=1 Tax=Panicum hallii TaxID=206008 RepID=A0A2S3IHU4_9POAL|nr:hypothetical protein PAHAL_9G078100 [Panicum hallii]
MTWHLLLHTLLYSLIVFKLTAPAAISLSQARSVASKKSELLGFRVWNWVRFGRIWGSNTGRFKEYGRRQQAARGGGGLWAAMAPPESASGGRSGLKGWQRLVGGAARRRVSRRLQAVVDVGGGVAWHNLPLLCFLLPVL